MSDAKPTPTPTPWTYENNSACCGASEFSIIGPGRVVADAYSESDATLIVRAVNAHEALVAELTQAKAALLENLNARLRAPHAAPADDERKSGRSKLVYDKAKRTIVSVPVDDGLRVPQPILDDDMLDDVIHDATSNGEGYLTPYYLRHHLAKAGLRIVPATVSEEMVKQGRAVIQKSLSVWVGPGTMRAALEAALALGGEHE